MRKTFKSAIHEHLSLHVGGLFNGEVSVGIYEGNKLLKGLTVANSDAPALALAILEAAGVKPVEHESCSEASAEALEHVAHWLADHIECVAKKTKEAADREALERRRDEVANELFEDTISYKMCNRAFQNAIDRIIELEDKAKS